MSKAETVTPLGNTGVSQEELIQAVQQLQRIVADIPPPEELPDPFDPASIWEAITELASRAVFLEDAEAELHPSATENGGINFPGIDLKIIWGTRDVESGQRYVPWHRPFEEFCSTVQITQRETGGANTVTAFNITKDGTQVNNHNASTRTISYLAIGR